jgi:predicted PolB exonuclease-like 3'-5' exonuclease
MLTNNHVVIDIETCIDKEAMEKSVIKDIGLESYDEFIEYQSQFLKKGKRYFPKPVFHKIKCIGLFFISPIFNTKYIDFAYESEDITLHKFWNVFSQCQLPIIVSFNGISFDMPVISMRSGKYIELFKNPDTCKIIKRYHNTDDKWEKYGPNYLNNYSNYHIDLINNMGNSRPSLIEACSLYDIPVKTKGHGKNVEQMTIEQTREYCKEDVMSTTKLWSYHMLKHNQDFDHHDFECINSIVDKEMVDEMVTKTGD